MRLVQHSLGSRGLLQRREGLPSWRTVATVAAIVVTAVLILELGVWYFVALIAIYAALDVAQRQEMRREAHKRMVILNSVGQSARSVAFFGLARHCQQAAWVAKRLGWIACPMVRERLLRHSVRFKYAPGAAPLTDLLKALDAERLATSIDLLEQVPSFGRKLSEQSLWDAGPAT